VWIDGLRSRNVAIVRVRSTTARPISVPLRPTISTDCKASIAHGRRSIITSALGAFYVPRIGISTNIDAFIPPAGHVIVMRFRPEGPRIPVPNWLIEWSKSRDLFLSLAHDPWVFRPN